ncbi:MAG: LysE family transporter [Clostridiales bacterium]|jgi:threonine/homoserine/homoserine lactone efflux protein|nr:LysE family transporter [Clostridiales bacterium]
MFITFISSVGLGLSGAVMPGPLLTYTIRNALTRGWPVGLIIIAGHGLLEIALISVIFLGFDIVLQSSVAQIVIHLAGGCFLIYMGVDMLISSIKNSISISADTGNVKSGNMMLTSAALSASNPYFIIWWATIGLGYMLDAARSFGVPGVMVFYFGHFIADVSWYILIAAIVGKTRRFIKEKPYRLLVACLGSLLILFGARFLIGAVTGIIRML